MALINSLQSFSPWVASGTYNADPVYVQILINFKGKSITDFLSLSPGIAGGDGRRAEGDLYVISGPPLPGSLLPLHTLLLALQIEWEKVS